MKSARKKIAKKSAVKKLRNPKTPKNISISFLGGLGEIGKNITVYEYDGEIIIVDCGLAFPDGNMHGVDAVIPDFTEVDHFDLDIIFDDDFRNPTSVHVGDVFDISFDIVDNRIGIQKIEVIGIRKDRPLNHLENR